MNMINYSNSKNLYRTIVRVSKENASFLYFMLESNEGIAFYSTVEESLQESFRDIKITCTPEYHEKVLHLLNFLRKTFPIDLILEEWIQEK
jgi:hypothetical protein